MWYLTVAFIAVWVLVTLYVLYMTSRQRKLELDLAALEETLQERQKNS